MTEVIRALDDSYFESETNEKQAEHEDVIRGLGAVSLLEVQESITSDEVLDDEISSRQAIILDMVALFQDDDRVMAALARKRTKKSRRINTSSFSTSLGFYPVPTRKEERTAFNNIEAGEGQG
jgi:PIN domain nuclease of toxin-antitoxin system